MNIDWENLQSMPDAEFYVVYGKYMASYEAMNENEKAEENKLRHVYLMSTEYHQRQTVASNPAPKAQGASSPFSTLRLVLNILSIAIAVFAAYQSMIVRITEAILSNGYSGTIGFIVALLMITGGIVGIAMLKKQAGMKACIIIFGIAAILGILCCGTFGDLRIYGIYCAIVCIVNFVAGVKASK